MSQQKDVSEQAFFEYLICFGCTTNGIRAILIVIRTSVY